MAPQEHPNSKPCDERTSPGPLATQIYVWSRALGLVQRHCPKEGPGSQALKSQLRTLLGVSLGHVVFILCKAQVQRKAVLYQSTRQVRPWLKSLFQSLLCSLGVAACSSWLAFVQERLSRTWRQHLTRGLHQGYFQNRCYYRLAQGCGSTAILDANVRIAEEVPQLCSNVSALLVTSVAGGLQAVTFSALLCKSGRFGVAAAVAVQLYCWTCYAVANRLVPRELLALLGRAAAARARLARAVYAAEASAEAICALQGGALERAAVRQRLRDAVEAKRASLAGMEGVDTMMYLLASSAVDSTPLLWHTYCWAVAAALSALRLRAFGPSLRSSANTSFLVTMHLGCCVEGFWSALYAMQSTLVVTKSLTDMLANYGTIERLQELDDRLALDGVDHVRSEGAASSDHLAFKEVSVKTPAGALLVEGLSLEVRRGESLLLTGHNGAGKSSLFRCLSGLWPVAAGAITPPRSLYYLPQRPCNALGTLAEQLTYPEPPPCHLRDASEGTREELRRWLDCVDLGHLVDIPGALDTEIDWERALSLGEQQRVGILRLLLHRPHFAVLDECTSAVTGEIERRMFELCARLGISCITIAHRPALQQYHHRQLVLTGLPQEADGGYRVVDLAAPAAAPSLGAALSPGERAGRGAAALVANAAELGRAIESYAEARSLELAGVRRQRTRDVLDARTASLRTATGACRGGGGGDAPAGRCGPGAAAEAGGRGPARRLAALSALLEEGLLADSRTRRQLWAVALCLLARTHLCFRTTSSLSRVIMSVVYSKRFGFARTLATNLTLVCSLWAADTAVKRLVQALQLQFWERTAGRLHEAYFRRGALHRAAAAALAWGGPNAVAGRSGAGVAEAEALAEGLGNVLLHGAKPLLLLTYGIGWAARSASGWRPFLLLAVLAAVQVAAPRLSGITAAAADVRQQHAEVAAAEARLRTVHARFRRNIEPVAFSGGCGAERRVVERRLAEVLEVRRVQESTGLPHRIVQLFLTRGDLAPSLAISVISALQTWATSGGVQGFTFKDAVQTFTFDNSLFLAASAMGGVAKLPEQIAVLAGEADRLVGRLAELERAAEAAPWAPDVESQGAAGASAGLCPNPGLSVRRLNLVAPDSGEALALGINFEVRRKRALVITGPTASGKSTLAAVLAGLRPAAGADAEVVVGEQPITGRCRPSIFDLMLLPQNPYLAPGGLADQVTYPLVAADVLASSAAVEARVSACLEAVGLKTLLHRYQSRSWTTEPDHPWEDVLSGGEQQRLAIARCLFQRPAVAVLDECTTMVSQEAEADLYKQIVESGIVPLTISQRLTLPEFHTQELRLGLGTVKGWELKRAKPAAAG